jgi:hypothetical protein
MLNMKRLLLASGTLLAIAVMLMISTPVAAGPTPCSYPCLLTAEAEAEVCAANTEPGTAERQACLEQVQDDLTACLATSCRK